MSRLPILEDSSIPPPPDSMGEGEPRTYGGVSGKVRRFFSTLLQPGRVEKQIAEREGDCNRCGRCCKIGFVCPFLEEFEDGSSRCRVYAVRPLQCRKYPIVARDLADVNGLCTYTFPASSSVE